MSNVLLNLNRHAALLYTEAEVEKVNWTAYKRIMNECVWIIGPFRTLIYIPVNNNPRDGGGNGFSNNLRVQFHLHSAFLIVLLTFPLSLLFVIFLFFRLSFQSLNIETRAPKAAQSFQFNMRGRRRAEEREHGKQTEIFQPKTVNTPQ